MLWSYFRISWLCFISITKHSWHVQKMLSAEPQNRYPLSLVIWLFPRFPPVHPRLLSVTHVFPHFLPALTTRFMFYLWILIDYLDLLSCCDWFLISLIACMRRTSSIFLEEISIWSHLFFYQCLLCFFFSATFASLSAVVRRNGPLFSVAGQAGKVASPTIHSLDKALC